MEARKCKHRFSWTALAGIGFVHCSGCLAYDPAVGLSGFDATRDWLGFPAYDRLTLESIETRVIESYPLGTFYNDIWTAMPDNMGAKASQGCESDAPCKSIRVHDSRTTLPCSPTSFLDVIFEFDSELRLADVDIQLYGVCL